MVDNIMPNIVENVSKVVENVEKVAGGIGKVGGKVADVIQEAVQTTVSDTDTSGLEEFTLWNYMSSFFIHIALIVIVIGLKWQYDRNRYRYPKGPRDWRHISDAISFHRKKRENLLVLANDYPDLCTVITHIGRVVLLNDPSLINEIFIGRADLCSNKIDSYLENQLRYKPGKHLRTGIVFRHYDHNGQTIHRSLVECFDEVLTENKLDQIIQGQFEQFRSYLISNSSKFDVRHSTFNFALHILTQLCINRTFKYDDKVFETFTNNLYKISKTIHEDTVAKTSKTALTQLTGLSETLDINDTVLNYIQQWVKERHPNEDTSDSTVTSTSSGDILDSILKVVPTSSPHIDNEDVAAMLLDVVMHGSEMLKGALTWLLLYVVRHPEEADRARNEAKSQNYSKFNLKNAEKLSYCQAFVKEVLRVSPVVPIVIHSTLQDLRWRDYHLQKRTLFGANVYALHYSIHWSEPTKFKVERWIGDNAEKTPQNSYAPFGIGPRQCIAEKYLFSILTGLLATLLYHFKFEKCGSIPDPHEGTFGMANLPPSFSLSVQELRGDAS